MEQGSVLWITGLSATGKTTVASLVVHELRMSGVTAVLLDGDVVRAAIADPKVAYDPAGRLANAHRMARLACLIASQNLTVVVATISLFRDVHAWNRDHLPGYFEVLLEASMETRAGRDPKGLYARAREGREADVAGLDLAVELPLAAHLTIANNGGALKIPMIVRSIVDAFLKWRRDGSPSTEP